MSVTGKREFEHREPCDHVSGIILAGGLSKRYGRNKAFLEINGVRLIDHITEKMKRIFKEVMLVANDKEDYEYLGLPIVEDRIKGLGPIGGIYTGLMSISNQAGFFVACDMPSLNEPLVRYMVGLMDNYAAVVPFVAHEVEPLHALYATTCIDPIQRLIKAQRYQVRLFYQYINIRYVGEDEIKEFAPPQRVFQNINTPQEFAAIESQNKG